jgi:AraC family ethanolamine operon transcriptional activator
LPYLSGDIPGDRASPNAIRVVRAAEKACRDLAHPPSIADLCATAGVGEVWLHKCFVEVYNTPPARFLLRRRLSAARNRLLDPDTPARSVKDAALSLGFMEAGRFAQHYKALYGENPGQTLLRSQRR